MVAGVEMKDAANAFGHYGRTQNHEVIAALRRLGVKVRYGKAIRVKNNEPPSARCLVKVTCGALPSWNHWVVCLGDDVYDPGWGMNPLKRAGIGVNYGTAWPRDWRFKSAIVIDTVSRRLKRGRRVRKGKRCLGG